MAQWKRIASAVHLHLLVAEALWQEDGTVVLVAPPVTTGDKRDHFHRNHRGPGTHPVVLRRFFAQADSARCTQGLSARH